MNRDTYNDIITCPIKAQKAQIKYYAKVLKKIGKKIYNKEYSSPEEYRNLIDNHFWYHRLYNMQKRELAQFMKK